MNRDDKITIIMYLIAAVLFLTLLIIIIFSNTLFPNPGNVPFHGYPEDSGNGSAIVTDLMQIIAMVK